MTVYYTKERSKFGGITGSILPFTIQLPDFNDPADINWKKYLPAGYLRCNGDILSASTYPSLAAVLGVGSASKFAKNPETMLDNEFQLPDLGSKYIRASNANGEYFNLTLSDDPSTYKVGTEINVSSLIGTEETFGYSGNFEIISKENIEFIGSPVYKTETGYTTNDALNIDNFQAHNHEAPRIGVFTYLAPWSDSSFVGTYGQNTIVGRGGNSAQTEGSNNLLDVDPPSGSTITSTHNHRIKIPRSTELKTNTTFSYGFPDNIEVSAEGLESTVYVTAERIKKLDDAISPYILVEYIIKI